MRNTRRVRFQLQTPVLRAGEPCGKENVMLQNLVVGSWSGRGILCRLERGVIGRSRSGGGFFVFMGCKSGTLFLLWGGKAPQFLSEMKNTNRIHEHFYPDRLRETSLSGRSMHEEFASDRSRILFCTSFRRMMKKAQVFSLEENTFVRNRHGVSSLQNMRVAGISPKPAVIKGQQTHAFS